MCEPHEALGREAFQREMMRRCEAFGASPSWAEIKGFVDDYLRDSKIEFGHPDHDWCAQAAREMADECYRD